MRRLVLVGLCLLAVGAAAARASTANDPVPTPIGAGPLFHPPAANSRAKAGDTIRGLRCMRGHRRWTAFHLELFARGRVVIVPAGIGVAAPHASDGVHVDAGRCSYPLRTREPTGVVEIAAGSRHTLGDFFDLWGMPLTATRLAGFTAATGQHVRAYVGGRGWLGDVRAIPLAAHAQIVLQVGPYVPPHASYRFPKGL